MSSTERPSGPESLSTGHGGQSAAARRTAADRSRLRTSEAAVANEVIEFQLARQRRGLDLDAPIEPLTAREREVIRLVAAGWSDGEIAEQLFISRKTASVHVANIKGKLGAASRVDIAMLAARMGLDDEGVAPPSATPPRHGSRKPPMCPFKGLASFETADAAFFFGRERVVGETVARLVGSTFLALVGPSGSGKSSILKAGLVPAISAGILPDSEHWTVTVARPGSTPARALRQALSAALPPATEGTPPDSGIEGLLAHLPMQSRLLLIVDQFEEIFSVCEDEDERAEAIRTLVGLAGDARSRAVVVLAMRADFYGRCAAYRDLADLLAANHVLVGPMASDELARAIDLPARAAGLRIEPELTAGLASDVLDEPGGLPLLSTTLLELWQRREGRTIRLATYERIGGVRGAVARLAESVYTRLPAENQAAAKSILLRLTAPGGGQFVSRPVPLRELQEHRDPAVGEVLDTLTDARLVTVAEGVVEVAHEALLTEWPRLRDWLLEDAEGRRTWDHLARAAREWDRAGRDPGELYRGARLAGALDWASGHERDLNDVEHAFLAESRAALERETDRQRGINRRLRSLLTGAVVLLVVAIGAGVFAALQLDRAEREGAAARAAEQLAALQLDRAEREGAAARAAEQLVRSRELAASALAVLDEDPELSKLLALAASSMADPSLETLSALHRAHAAIPVIYRHSWPGDAEDLVFADLDPSGTRIVATKGFGSPGHDFLEVIDPDSGEVVWSFRPDHEAAAVGLGLFTPDGEFVVAGVYRDPFAQSAAPPPRELLGAYVWRAATGELVGGPIDLGDCGGLVGAVSSSHLLARTKAAPDCFVPPPDVMALEVVDRRTGERRRLTTKVLGDLEAISADGRYAAFNDGAGETDLAIVLDLRSNRPVLELPSTATDRVRDLSRDGSRLLYGDDPIEVWDVGSQVMLTEFAGHSDFSNRARFGQSGDVVLSTGRDAGLRGWSPETAEQLFVVSGIGVDNGRAVGTSSGRILLVRGRAEVVLLDVAPRGELDAFEVRPAGEGCGMLWDSLRFQHPYARFADLCVGRHEWTMRVVDITRAAAQQSVTGGGGQAGFELSPDGMRLVRQEATGTAYGGITIRDLASGDELRTMEGLCSYVNSDDPPENCRAFPTTPFFIWAFRLRWSPDGSMIAVVPPPDPDWGGFVAVWSAHDGKLLPGRRLEPGQLAHDVMFTPDSRQLVVSFVDGSLEKWSTDRWEVVGDRLDLPGALLVEFFGFLPDSTTLLALSGFQAGDAALHWIDSTTLREIRPRVAAIQANPTSIALSPSGSLLAAGGQDGAVRVWDSASGTLRHQVSLGETGVLAVAFVTEAHLAVVLADGHLRLVTIDADELLGIVRRSLTRGFTPTECARFNFGDACPSLDELRAG